MTYIELKNWIDGLSLKQQNDEVFIFDTESETFWSVENMLINEDYINNPEIKKDAPFLTF